MCICELCVYVNYVYMWIMCICELCVYVNYLRDVSWFGAWQVSHLVLCVCIHYTFTCIHAYTYILVTCIHTYTYVVAVCHCKRAGRLGAWGPSVYIAYILYIYVHAYIYTYIYIYTYVCTYKRHITYIYTYIYTYIHTHTHVQQVKESLN